MEIAAIPGEFSICKVADYSQVDLASEYCFIGKTDEECSLVCPMSDVPDNATEQNDGWRAFRLQGILDFSLTGILAKLSAVLASESIGIFAISTFNTDYVLVRKADFSHALAALGAAGYEILRG